MAGARPQCRRWRHRAVPPPARLTAAAWRAATGSSSGPGGVLHHPHVSGIPVQQEQWKKDGIDVTEWHNWAFEWTAAGLKVWGDGVEVFAKSGGAKTVEGKRRKNIQEMPQGRLTHQLDMFKPDGTTMRPAKMEIASVRFYDVP